MNLTRFLLISLFLISSLFSKEIITLNTRDSVKQSFLLELPENEAKAIVVLFPGGNGKINLYKNEDKWNTNNFLIRSRKNFLRKDFIVVSIDVPTDRKSKDGMYYNFRTSKEHTADIKRVLKYLKNNFDKPIFLIGTSRGTESVAFLATKLDKLINGIVLSSSISKKNSKGKSLQEIELNEIKKPTLIIYNKDDECKVTPPKGSNEIFNLLDSDLNKEIKSFSGGKNKNTNPCKAMTYHGFLGKEKEVINYINVWIEKLL